MILTNLKVIWDMSIKLETPGTCSTIGTPCAITEIIDASGDGNPLDSAKGIAVDSSDNIYVTGYESHNAFKIQWWVPPVPALSIGALIITTGLLGFTGWRRLHI